ncbi:MAG: ParB/RepB/Spo0J family partition protein [Clostridia bacterium]|nr:ParB/RepB/Spo0J family partition protein [Clostridia bacterium]MBQ5793900.1 ParB/RepB/Spo0J family partition protein [Clostridia bacterium]
MARKQGGLGRNFYEILDDNMLETKKDSVTKLRVADIEPRRDQPRKDFDLEPLQALADSVRDYGVLVPLIVRENPVAVGTYEIIAGERRWRAAKMAGISEVPVVIMDSDDMKTSEIALIENVQRQDLNPVEEAFAYQALIDRFGLTQEEVARKVGKNRSTITNMLRLLELPEGALELLKKGDISGGHARALLGLDDEAQIVDLAQKIVEKDYSVRETEKIVRLFKANAEKGDEPEELDESDAQRKVYMKDLERRVMRTLGRKVRIARVAKKKVVELSYEDDQDLETIIKKLCGEDFFTDI